MTTDLHTMTTLPSELGDSAAEGVRDLIRRATKGAPIATYAEGEPPLTWSELSAGGWDELGALGDGDGASLRDLVEIARAWGRGCIQLPLVSSLMAKRHSPVAAGHDGPVTIAVPLPGGTAYVPFGELDGIALASVLGADGAELLPPGDGIADSLGLTARGRIVADPSSLSLDAARELAVVIAAEATGAAEQLLADSIEFAKERQQFGKPIGSFQAVKHQIADAAIAAEQAETAVIWAAERPTDAFRGAALAISRSIDIAEIAIQVHGGLGFTWEMGLHFPLRHVMLARELVEGLEQAHA